MTYSTIKTNCGVPKKHCDGRYYRDLARGPMFCQLILFDMCKYCQARMPNKKKG